MEPVVGNAKPVWKVFVTAENLEKALTKGRFLVVLTKMEILSCLPRVWTSNRPDAFASMETQTPRPWSSNVSATFRESLYCTSTSGKSGTAVIMDCTSTSSDASKASKLVPCAR